MPDPPITRSQIRAIHIALRRQGVEDADYRALLLDGWGVTTCKDLTRRQAHELIQRLPGPPARTPRRRREAAPRRLPAGVVRMATRAQFELIHSLSREIEWRSAAGFAGWLWLHFGLRRVVTSAQARKVIEGMLAIRRRADA